MNLLRYLKTRLSSDVSMMEMAERIADRSFELVWRNVQGRILTLAPAEARGYVRARARGPLQHAIEEQRLSGGYDSRVYVLALDKTVRRVTHHAEAIQSGRSIRAAA